MLQTASPFSTIFEFDIFNPLSVPLTPAHFQYCPSIFAWLRYISFPLYHNVLEHLPEQGGSSCNSSELHLKGARYGSL